LVEGYDSDVVVGGIINNTVDVTLRIDLAHVLSSILPPSLSQPLQEVLKEAEWLEVGRTRHMNHTTEEALG
jgi:hypothetical protein